MNGLSFHWLRKRKNTDEKATPLLRIHDLSVKVGIREVLTGICLDVYSGDQILISGPNGSGKSTLFNAITGVMPARPTKGTIFFAGKDISSQPTHVRSGMGLAYLRQQEFLFEGLTIGENLHLMLGKNGPYQFQQRFPEWKSSLGIKKQVGLLSGGQKKKLAWAVTILARRKLWLFDEPEAGLSEPFTVADDQTFIMVSHGKEAGGLK